MDALIREIEVRTLLTAQGKTGRGIPTEYTINPYRGCLFGCTYCLAPETRVRLSDLDEKPLGEVAVGDTLLGFEEHTRPRAHRHFRHSVVEGVQWSRRPAFRIVTQDAEVVSTADHLWLCDDKWVQAERLGVADHLRYLPATVGDDVGKAIQGKRSRVLHVEPVGFRDVVDIQTSARTFLANDLATHNCYARKFVYEDAVKKADWGRWIEVKKNAVEALGRESHKLFGREVFVGSATDPYQPIETKVGLTRALLEVLLAAYPARVHLQTRSPHVVRDIELFRRFGDTLTIGVSIPTDSDVVRKAFEPRAPSIARRLEAARALNDAGIRVRATIAPLLPGTPERLARLLQGKVEKAWVGTIQFYEQEEALRAIYAARGWERYLHRAFADETKAALAAAGLCGE